MASEPERLARRTVYRSPWIALHLDRVALPTGRVIEDWHVLDHPRASVAVLAEGSGGGVLLERVHRYVTGRSGWEVPAGGVEAGEDPLAAAEREVREETGIATRDHRLLRDYHPANGMSNQRVHVVLCTADDGPIRADRNEIEGARWFARGEVDALLDDGVVDGTGLHDGLTLVALLLWLRGEGGRDR